MGTEIIRRIGSYGTYYGTEYNTTGSEYFSSNDSGRFKRYVNVVYIYNYLTSQGWTLNAIAGLLGNIDTESDFNPGIWQGNSHSWSGGYGLVQWTPATKYTQWCAQRELDPSAIDSNLARIVWESGKDHEGRPNSTQYSPSSSRYAKIGTFSDFIVSKEAPAYLAGAFAWNYEKSAVVLYGAHSYDDALSLTEEQKEANRQALECERGSQANYWYTFLANFKFISRAKYDQTTGKTTEANPRTEQQIANTLAYSAYNINSSANRFNPGYGMPNCTCYAYGRFFECIAQAYNNAIAACNGILKANATKNDIFIHNKASTRYFSEHALVNNISTLSNIFGNLCGRNAGVWIDAHRTDISANGPTCVNNHHCSLDANNNPLRMHAVPKRGAVAVFRKSEAADATSGHVAIVEDIVLDDSGKVTKLITSDSAYQGTYWFSRVRTGQNWGTYIFQGFVYSPFNFETGATAALPEIISIPTKVTFTGISDITSSQITVYGSADLGTSAESQLVYSFNGITDYISFPSGAVDSSTGDFLFNVSKIDKEGRVSLIPNTRYIINIFSLDDTSTVFFHSFTTDQSYPAKASAITLSTLNSTAHKLSTETFKVVFNIPEKDNWGYWKDNERGYDIYSIINGRVNRISSHTQTTSNSSTIINQYIPEALGAKPGDNFQIGVRTWVKDAAGNKIEDPNGLVYSNSICLKECTHEVYLPKLVKG